MNKIKKEENENRPTSVSVRGLVIGSISRWVCCSFYLWEIFTIKIHPSYSWLSLKLRWPTIFLDEINWYYYNTNINITNTTEN